MSIDDSHSFLAEKLLKREKDGLLRRLKNYPQNFIDFFSNDYLSFSRNQAILDRSIQLIEKYEIKNGATGSRLISGNYALYEQAEDLIAKIHGAESSLIFNSGYDANVGFWSCVPQRGDYILYDEIIHASIRDGIRLSVANSFSFKHNNVSDFRNKLAKTKGRVFVAVESVYSMDGDLVEDEILSTCKEYSLNLVIDEAHSFGVLGINFKSSTNSFNPFARIVTFGKALGCQGAAILGNSVLREYLINYSRSFIYTTALPPHSVASIISGYQILSESTLPIDRLQSAISYFNKLVVDSGISSRFVSINNSAIKALLLNDKLKTKFFEEELLNKKILVKGIYEPTVPRNKERVRICIHAHNTKTEIDLLVNTLLNYL